MHLNVFDVAVFGVDHGIAAEAEEGIVALLDPAGLFIGAGHHFGLAGVIHLDGLLGRAAVSMMVASRIAPRLPATIKPLPSS